MFKTFWLLRLEVSAWENRFKGGNETMAKLVCRSTLDIHSIVFLIAKILFWFVVQGSVIKEAVQKAQADIKTAPSSCHVCMHICICVHTLFKLLFF